MQQLPLCQRSILTGALSTMLARRTFCDSMTWRDIQPSRPSRPLGSASVQQRPLSPGSAPSPVRRLFRGSREPAVTIDQARARMDVFGGSASTSTESELLRSAPAVADGSHPSASGTRPTKAAKTRSRTGCLTCRKRASDSSAEVIVLARVRGRGLCRARSTADVPIGSPVRAS
jgi:hypothetical protein